MFLTDEIYTVERRHVYDAEQNEIIVESVDMKVRGMWYSSQVKTLKLVRNALDRSAYIIKYKAYTLRWVDKVWLIHFWMFLFLMEMKWKKMRIRIRNEMVKYWGSRSCEILSKKIDKQCTWEM